MATEQKFNVHIETHNLGCDTPDYMTLTAPPANARRWIRLASIVQSEGILNLEDDIDVRLLTLYFGGRPLEGTETTVDFNVDDARVRITSDSVAVVGCLKHGGGDEWESEEIPLAAITEALAVGADNEKPEEKTGLDASDIRSIGWLYGENGTIILTPIFKGEAHSRQVIISKEHFDRLQGLTHPMKQAAIEELLANA